MKKDEVKGLVAREIRNRFLTGIGSIVVFKIMIMLAIYMDKFACPEVYNPFEIIGFSIAVIFLILLFIGGCLLLVMTFCKDGVDMEW